MKNDREYRDMQLRAVANEEYKVEGYASTFEPYVLFSMDDIDYKEQIMPTAFDECDMTDCVFRVDHEGTVYARTSAGTVETYTDEHGLKTIADLSRKQKREAFGRISKQVIILKCLLHLLSQQITMIQLRTQDTLTRLTNYTMSVL